MGIGKASDFVIYEEEFWGGFTEILAQESDIFGAKTNGAFRFVTQQLKGQYEKESFLKIISGLIIRRDLTSVAAATDLAPTQDEFISVKCARTIGPVANTLDAWRKIGENSKALSFRLGQQIAKAVMVEYANAAIRAGSAAILGQSNLVQDSSSATISHVELVNAMAKLGDASSRIVCWVMYGKVAHDLLKQGIADNVDMVAGAAIIKGSIASFNRPILMIDSAPLALAGSVYATLGLQEGAVTINESESREIVFDLVTGLKNLVYRLQGEYAFNVGVKGMKWDVGNGGANPDDTALGTTTNWDKAATDDKDLAGVALKTL